MAHHDTAWETLLAETEEIAKDRIALADKILAEVADPLKTVAARKEEARKKVCQEVTVHG